MHTYKCIASNTVIWAVNSETFLVKFTNSYSFNNMYVHIKEKIENSMTSIIPMIILTNKITYLGNIKL